MEAEERPIGELFAKLVDDGKSYAKAEAGLAKSVASAKAQHYRTPAILLASAVLFLIAAVVMLIVTVGLALATLIGPLAGGLAATLLALAIAGGLALVARNLMSARP